MAITSLVFIMEIMGIIGFAVSGALLAVKKDFDILGIVIIGIVTAVGGGLTRDIVIGSTPPSMFINPIYCLTAAIASLLICIPFIRRFLNKKNIQAITMIVMDSIGLAVFTINGILVCAKLYPDNYFLLFFTGVVSGVGGGVIRDILCGEKPYIFTKHIYACAAAIGAIVYLVMITVTNKSILSSLIGAGTILLIRFISAYFRLKLPHIKNIEET